jgi:hypothetical protein
MQTNYRDFHAIEYAVRQNCVTGSHVSSDPASPLTALDNARLSIERTSPTKNVSGDGADGHSCAPQIRVSLWRCHCCATGGRHLFMSVFSPPSNTCASCHRDYIHALQYWSCTTCAGRKFLCRRSEGVAGAAPLERSAPAFPSATSPPPSGGRCTPITVHNLARGRAKQVGSSDRLEVLSSS